MWNAGKFGILFVFKVKIVPMQNEAQGVKSYKSDYYGEMQEKKSCEIPFYQHIITDISYIE